MDKMKDAIEKTIRKVFHDGAAAWNRGDLDGYLAGYWDSEETRWARGGVVVRGKDAISRALKARFQSSPEQMGIIRTESLEIDVLSDKDALVFGQLIHTAGDAVHKGLFTVHVRNFHGDWRVVSDHFSPDA